MGNEQKFTVEEIRNYILSKDSLGDVVYYLSAENIIKANEKKQKEQENNRGCCEECGEGFDNEEEWKYNTHCEACGHPIPEHLIIKRPEDE
jgi:PHP family Zn ribbon phosphoesterase